ncbi:MAG: energy transducer TonB [Arcobacter sp.]|uniref:energy transducer TonB n=1 Tax=Arcobacter sp. TaxID=1872629 RepID=UPI003D08D413
MNRIIILISFSFVLVIHLLLLYFYKNSQILKPYTKENSNVQIQLTKISKVEKEQKKQQPQQEQTIVKKEIPKIPQKEPLKKSENVKNIEKQKVIEKQETIKEETVTTKTEEKNITQENITKKDSTIDEINENVNKEIEALIDDYGKKLRDEINKNKNYPTISKKLKEQGKVIVRFKVLKNGLFDDISILISSNKERLDNAALNALYDTKKYLPYDNRIKKEFIEYNLPLEFVLN